MSRSIAAAVACLLLALPQPAPAADGPGCGGAWSGKADCSMVFVGFPVSVFGTSESSSTARLRVWLSPGGSPEVSLLECSASGSRAATCGRETSDDGLEDLDFLPHGTRLRLQCNVSGTGSGTYFCASGKG